MAQDANIDPREELHALTKSELVERVIALQDGKHGQYDDEEFGYMCRQIMSGRTARSVFRKEEDDDKENAPSRASFYRWLSRRDLNELFDVRERYEFAMTVSMHDMNDEMIDIADDGSNDWMEKHNKDGQQIGWMENGESARRSKLRVDTRDRMIARMAPKKFGPRALERGEDKSTVSPERVIRMYDVKSSEVPDVQG